MFPNMQLILRGWTFWRKFSSHFIKKHSNNTRRLQRRVCLLCSRCKVRITSQIFWEREYQKCFVNINAFYSLVVTEVCLRKLRDHRTTCVWIWFVYDELFLSIWVLGSMLKPKKEWIIMIEFKEKIWKECKKVQCMYLETSWLFWPRIIYLLDNLPDNLH